MLSSYIDKKYFKIIVIFLIILFVILGIKFFFLKKTPEKIEDYVINQGYKENENGVFIKENSNITKSTYDSYVSLNRDVNYSVNTFDLYNYELTKDEYEYKDKITTSLIQTYDYKDRSLLYTYRINSDNMNVMYRGEYYYEDEEFTCEKEISYGVALSNTESLICNRIKVSVLNFALEATTFFKNADFDNYMKNYEEKYEEKTESGQGIEEE